MIGFKGEVLGSQKPSGFLFFCVCFVLFETEECCCTSLLWGANPKHNQK